MDWSINSCYIFGRGIFVSLIQSQMSDSQRSEMTFPNFHTSILLVFGLVLKALKIKTDLRCYVNPTQHKPLTLLFSKPFTTQLATQ